MALQLSRARKIKLTTDDIACLKAYGRVVRHGLPNFLSKMISAYVVQYVPSRLGGKNVVLRDCLDHICHLAVAVGGRVVARFIVNLDEETLEVTELDESAIDLREVVQMFEVMGQVALGVAEALYDVLQQHRDQLCTDEIECEHLLELVIYVLEVIHRHGALVLPDADVYEQIKELMLSGGLPFRSRASVDADDYASFLLYAEYAKEALLRLFSMPEEYSDKLVKTLSGIRTVSGSTASARLHLFPAHPESIDITVAGFNVRFTLEAGVLSVFVGLEDEGLYQGVDGVKRLAEAVRNWNHHVTRALDEAISIVESERGIPRDYLRPVVDYLRVWRDLLVKYRDKIEENKRIH